MMNLIFQVSLLASASETVASDGPREIHLLMAFFLGCLAGGFFIFPVIFSTQKMKRTDIPGHIVLPDFNKSQSPRTSIKVSPKKDGSRGE
ncbi:MAG: hypothetical protein NE328_19195 [Lentisphaeraceae bacterium]|nr:hypothetical protein [Lentisphaeraceae bacterium]